MKSQLMKSQGVAVVRSGSRLLTSRGITLAKSDACQRPEGLRRREDRLSPLEELAAVKSQDVGVDRRVGLSCTSRGITQASIGAYLRPEGLRRQSRTSSPAGVTTLYPCHSSIRRAGDDAAAGSSYSQVVIFLFAHAQTPSVPLSHQCSRSYARSSYRARSISRPQYRSSQFQCSGPHL